MLSEKLSQDVVSLLCSGEQGLIEIVVEIASFGEKDVKSNQCDKGIEFYKEKFYEECKPVKTLIENNGGVVLGDNWLNKTIKANVSPGLIGDLTEHCLVARLHLPTKLIKE